MAFNTRQISPPPLADPWVDEDGIPTSDLINWFLITLLPSIAQSPSVFSSSGPVFDEEASDAIALTPLEVGDLSAGLYQVVAYLRVTQADGVSSSVTPIVSFDDDGVTCQMQGTALTSDAIDEPNSSVLLLEVDAPGPISIGTLYSSNTPNAMAYHLVATVLRVN